MPTFMRLVNVISRCGAAYRASRLKHLNLCAPHHSYIFNVCWQPGITQEELAEHICVDKSNVTRQIAHLECEGYVERRQAASDKRVWQVYPTQRALEVLPYVSRIIREWNEYVTQDLSEEELSQLMSAMQKVTKRAMEYPREDVQ